MKGKGEDSGILEEKRVKVRKRRYRGKKVEVGGLRLGAIAGREG